MLQKKSIIVKVESYSEQVLGENKKYVGLMRGKYIVPIIDNLNLEANPRSSKTGQVTDAIEDTLENSPMLFPFKSKGILLAASDYELLERDRIRITPNNIAVEGILDGGHNTLAIGLFILKKAFALKEEPFPKGSKNWDEFKEIWTENRFIVAEYLDSLRNDPENHEMDFFIPVEILVPRDRNDAACVNKFNNDLFEVCEARNNNAELTLSTKANQRGYFTVIKDLMERHNHAMCERVEWKTNDGGDIKVQDIVALAWISLSLLTPVRDENGRVIEPVAPNLLYNGKGACLKQYEKLMSSPDITAETDENYKRELLNGEVISAFKVAVELPELYDYIYETFPVLYNAAGGKYGSIVAVKNLNKKRKVKQTPFLNKEIETVSPEGFIVPLVYGLQALMENRVINGKREIVWSQPPMPFLLENLPKIVSQYAGIFAMCDYDPQKIGKATQSYVQTLNAFKMAIAGLI